MSLRINLSNILSVSGSVVPGVFAQCGDTGGVTTQGGNVTIFSAIQTLMGTALQTLPATLRLSPGSSLRLGREGGTAVVVYCRRPPGRRDNYKVDKMN